uniref:EGF-like domain-containing protein n=1 Tax=Podarcis muralis TaxID=64176 RepID=A0A670HZW2_PODMU
MQAGVAPLVLSQPAQVAVVDPSVASARTGAASAAPGYSGARCEEPPSCPDDCNDQGRCVDGRCACFPGYSGPSCADPACPQDCQGRGRCVDGQCVCDPGYSGPTAEAGPRGRCLKGAVCACHKGYTGPDCGQLACPEDCSGRGECQNGETPQDEIAAAQ